MKENTSLKSLFVSIILILAGLISPSNGVDERIHKTPMEIITTVLIIVVVAITIYFIWILVDDFKEVSKRNTQQGKENS